MPHIIHQRGMVIMREYGFTNYIEIDGKDVRMDSLSEDEQIRIAVSLQKKMMEIAGFKEKRIEQTA